MSRSRATSTGLALAAVVALLVYPLVVPRFWILSVASQSMILGIVALSLVFMAGSGGMVSLAQAALAGVGAYATALASLKLGLPPIPAAIIAVTASTAVGLLFGAIAARTQGIYLLMLTLALAMALYYLCLQNYDIFNGHIGFAGVIGPTGQPRANPAVFYYLCLGVAALVYLGLKYLERAPLGLTFQGIRDNPRRMRALGYWVTLHRIVLFGIGGFVAGVSGVLLVWYQGTISPGSVDLTRAINVLIIAVVGGMGYPIGAFVGAVFLVLVQTFASSLVLFGVKFDERFNTLIGLSFLLVVLFAPTGIVGLADRFRRAVVRRVGPARAGSQPLAAAAVAASPLNPSLPAVASAASQAAATDVPSGSTVGPPRRLPGEADVTPPEQQEG